MLTPSPIPSHGSPPHDKLGLGRTSVKRILGKKSSTDSRGRSLKETRREAGFSQTAIDDMRVAGATVQPTTGRDGDR